MKPWPEGAKAAICCRVNDPYRKDVPGSKVTACWQCGEAVMISPVAAAHAAQDDLTIICVQCYRAYFDASGQKTAEIPGDTPEQIAEQGYKRSWEGTIFREKGG